MEEKIMGGKETDEHIQEHLNRKERRREWMIRVLPFVGLLIVFVICLIGTGGALVSPSNLSNLLDQCFDVVLVAVGASFVYACGMMDISMGGTMAFAELIIGKLMLTQKAPWPVILLAGITVTVTFSLVTGFVSAYLKVPSFIVSLCVMNICSGFVKTSLTKEDLFIPYADYKGFNSGYVRILVLILVITVGMLLFNRTRLGRNLKAIGGNPHAAAQSGIQVNQTVLLGFGILGIIVGIVAFFGLTRSGVLNSTTGQSLGMDIMVAIVLGGFPLAGGARAKIIGAITGALTINVLTNGMTLTGLDASVVSFAKGCLFILIVGISYERKKGQEII